MQQSDIDYGEYAKLCVRIESARTEASNNFGLRKHIATSDVDTLLRRIAKLRRSYLECCPNPEVRQAVGNALDILEREKSITMLSPDSLAKK